MTINRTLSVSLCMLVSAAAFAADNANPVIMDARPCLDMASPIQRLACFEEQANAAQGRGAIPQQNRPVVSTPRNAGQQPVQSSSQSESQPATEAPQPAVSASVNSNDSFEDNFGLPEEKTNDGQAAELIARVAEIKEFDRNRLLITMDNGQVWEQVNSKRFALAEGDEVRIYPTRWGSSYRLASLSHKGYIQVKRLR